MQIFSPELIKDKKVLLRLDIDVPIKEGVVEDDFRLKAGLPTINLCLEHAGQVIIMGHIGRPEGKEDPNLSVGAIYLWLKTHGFEEALQSQKLVLLENLRFESGEDEASEEYAKQLAQYGDFFVNEAFASHHKAASTTVLPTLLPHAAGLRFAKEVKTLTNLKQNPKHPLVAIVGGAKVEDKYPSVLEFAKFCDQVLVGGLLAKRIQEQNLTLPMNVTLGGLNEAGLDLSKEALETFFEKLKTAQQVIWVGPVGKYEDEVGNRGNQALANTILNPDIESFIGGGDTIAALDKLHLLGEFTFVSVGGGAMLKLLSEDTLPTIQALE